MPTPKHILVVEDDSDVRQVIADQLEELGYRVSLADNGETMRAFLQTLDPIGLMVHPLSCCGIWHDGDPGAARGAVPPSMAPDERMLVRVPVRGGAPDGFFDLGPGLEAAPFEGQRAQDFPPRLD